MIRFLIKGVIRDRHRSLLPILVISLGVMLTTFMHGYLQGVFGDMIATSAKLESGHFKVMTSDYAAIAKQIPNDFAIQNLPEVARALARDYPLSWAPRIRFGGLLDIPDAQGETRAQGPIMGLGIDLFSPGSEEIARFDLPNVVIEGRLPLAPGELLISAELHKNLKVGLGETATIIGNLNNDFTAFTTNRNGHHPCFRLTSLFANLRRFDAMRYAITQHVLEWGHHTIQNMPVHFFVRAVQM